MRRLYRVHVLDLASRVSTRAERTDRAVSGMHARFAEMLPGGEVKEAGRAIWTVCAAPLLCANGVIRFDARDFHGPASQRELDTCLAVMSTFDLPWRFSAWAHLGAEVLLPHLLARGMAEVGTECAMWLDLPGDVLMGRASDGRTGLRGIEIRQVDDSSGRRTWADVFNGASSASGASGASAGDSDMVRQMVAIPGSIALVARMNRRAVGCLWLAIEQGLAVVHHIGVLPSARRRGVARQMLAAAHEAAAARGARACVALTTPEGAGLCAGLGHRAVTSVMYLIPPALGTGAYSA